MSQAVVRRPDHRDLGHARVWVSVLGTDAERERSMDALRVATPWLRRRLGERLTLRHVPELTLRLDDSIASGDRVLRILSELDEAGES